MTFEQRSGEGEIMSCEGDCEGRGEEEDILGRGEEIQRP
jgi:hypothetical protein